MASTVRTQTAPFGAITVHRIVRAFAKAAEAFRQWREVRRTVNALRRLTPAQLDDIGLTPADVEEIARRGHL